MKNTWKSNKAGLPLLVCFRMNIPFQSVLLMIFYLQIHLKPIFLVCAWKKISWSLTGNIHIEKWKWINTGISRKRLKVDRDFSHEKLICPSEAPQPSQSLSFRTMEPLSPTQLPHPYWGMSSGVYGRRPRAYSIEQTWTDGPTWVTSIEQPHITVN